MDLDDKSLNAPMDFNEENLIPIEAYDELVEAGVKCCTCKEDLTSAEIINHRYAGISKAEEMDCVFCWAKIAYEQN